MAEIVRNFLFIIIAFLAPFWFPLTQRIIVGKADEISIYEWIGLICILVIPILLIWSANEDLKKQRVNELQQVFKQALKEDREDRNNTENEINEQ